MAGRTSSTAATRLAARSAATSILRQRLRIVGVASRLAARLVYDSGSVCNLDTVAWRRAQI